MIEISWDYHYDDLRCLNILQGAFHKGYLSPWLFESIFSNLLISASG